MARTAVIIGTGMHLPDKFVTTEETVADFVKRGVITVGAEETIASFKARGYNQKGHITDVAMSTSMIATKAAQNALRNANLSPLDIDIIMLATDMPDYVCPATSARVQLELGAKNAGFFDVNTACGSFTTCLYMAWNTLRADPNVKHILVIGAVKYSSFLDPNCIVSQLTLTDAAGAVILKGVEDSPYGITAGTVKGKGEFWDYFGIYAGGSYKGFSKETLDAGLHYLKMPKKYPDDFNIHNWPPVIEETLKRAGWDKSDIQRGFFTQSTLKTIREVSKIFGWDQSLSYEVVQEYGYCGSGCIPVSMNHANERGVLKPGDKVLICTSGTGYSIAVLTLIWGK
jgi:3-oxoacyl-[acyl-carrier-protein] synthase-3